MKYIIALDQGTTSSRAVLFDEHGAIVKIEQQEFQQLFPQSGWVEHDPSEIFSSQFEVLTRLISKNKIEASSIKAIGIANQRQTTILWNKKTTEPIYNAIVWQDKVKAYISQELKAKGLSDYIKENTDLAIHSYFSVTKINRILEN